MSLLGNVDGVLETRVVLGFGVEGAALGAFALRSHGHSWRVAGNLFDHAGCDKSW